MIKMNHHTVWAVGFALSLLILPSQSHAQFNLDKMFGSPVKKLTQGITESIRVAPSAIIPGATIPIEKFTGKGGAKPSKGLPSSIEKLPGVIGSILDGGDSSQKPFVPSVPASSGTQPFNPVSIFPKKPQSGNSAINIGPAALALGQNKLNIGFGPKLPSVQVPNIQIPNAQLPNAPQPNVPAALLPGAPSKIDLPKFKNPFRN
jgi:hypothetical protein